ncbi:MAG: TonB-dependent receptor plug domain-containing protein [Bacteroidales bacterium]|nr:TonB-dependent receptor plug domain-containing protein [Bacteroidales bacterium]
MNKKIYLIVLCIIMTGSLKSQNIILSADSTEIPEIDIGEVSVEASKHNLSLKELPASVSLISSEAITDHEIRSLADVSSTIPNFFMPDYGSKLSSPVYIRGIGSRKNSPSVGLYVDNVPFFEQSSFNFDFFDIERIEVLRGPQGTLYGRNTMGGIINIITASPMERSGGHINLSTGNFGYYNGNASYYGSINESFGYSASFSYTHKDGYFANKFTGDAVDRSNAYGFRNKLIWNVNDRLTFKNVLNAEHRKEGGYPYAVLNDTTRTAEDINYNQYSYYNRKVLSDAFIIKYQADNFELVSTSAYQYLDDFQGVDQDFTADSLYYVNQDQKQHMFSQELIARSTGDSRYNWLTGLYAFRQVFDKAVDVDVYSSNMTLFKNYDHVIGGYALFHQSTLEDVLIKNLSVTAGIRVDFEKDVLDYNYDLERNQAFINMADTVYPSLEYFEILPKLALNYRFGSNTLYLTVARGYKTGGFNSTFERPEDLTFDPEFSWNYEIGARGTLLEKQLYVDIALFYIDWKNQQIYQTVPSGRGSMLKNAGRSESKGFEISLKAIPVCGYEASLTYGYTHATFISHVVDEETDHSGNYIPYVPANTLTFMLNKTYHINGSSLIDKINLNLIYRGTGAIYWNEENSHQQDYYSIADFKLGMIRNNLALDFWFKNLLNTDYEAFYFQSLGREYVQPGNPLHFGIRLSAKF